MRYDGLNIICDKAKPAVQLRKVELRGPASVKWSLSKGKALGAGNASSDVPTDVKSVFALDTKRGVRTTLPIVVGVVDYAKAPRGKLDLRAFPYADVFLGSESLGVTPLQPLPAVAEDKQTRAETMIEAHEAVVAANPANEAKFKDVLDYLKQDLHLPH